MEGLVQFERRGDIAVLTLNRADKRNALSLALWGELEAHLAGIEALGAELGAVVLRANGPVFCAGNDLKERGAQTPRPHYQSALSNGWRNCRSRCWSRCRAGALPAGWNWPWRGTSSLRGESASFADTHGKFCAGPDLGDEPALPRRVGQWKAREMSFTGLPVSGAEAARIGPGQCVRGR